MNITTPLVHKPVMVAEVLSYLRPQPGGLYVDATLGGGGHTRAILAAEPTCRVIGCDWDKESLDALTPTIQAEFPGRFEPLWGNFADLSRLLAKRRIRQLGGILADFGTSQIQISTKAGLSFSRDTPLDMRMSSAHFRVTAAHIINRASEAELAEIFWRYGEERFSRRIAHLIAEERKRGRIETTAALAALVCKIIPYRHGKIHPATRVFQALRIVVNHELDNINSLLSASRQLLEPGGRLVCISFHSLEDRMVKQFIRDHKQEFMNLTPHVVVASAEERAVNPSARSAKLRAAERVATD
ncbi:MAG: 16S rRNA (cytosine(1402)-N(4))-methyltransferase RsmH [Candidatus Dependentiae bacterium]|nr:16S rRNA (cytosine(1402)-N(4))-methyltransferase RsmH [Candidatus Dependentiae bacterium]